MPEGDAWECTVVFWLELGDDVKREAGLLGYLSVAAFVVFAVAYLFAHETVSVMSIEWGLSKIAYLLRRSPVHPKLRPNKSSNCCMHISRLHGIEELSIAEDVPDPPADTVGLAGLGVELGELIAWVGYKDRP